MPCWVMSLGCKPKLWQDTTVLESGFVLGGTAGAGCPHICRGAGGTPWAKLGS